MQYIQGINRNQAILFPKCLDELIDQAKPPIKNEKAIRKVFQYTVSIAKMFDLIGGKLIAGDSTKLRAQNSKKNNFNPKKIELLAYIDTKLNEYNEALQSADDDSKTIIENQIDNHNNHKEFYNNLT